MLLEVKNLSKSFGGIKAVRDISIGIEENSISSIIGPNGAGKTTFFNLMTGIYKPDTGEINFNGRVADRPASRSGQRRRSRAHLPEHPPVRQHDGA